MANYITSFSSTTAYDEAMNLDFPNVSLIESDGSLKYAKTPDYSKCYFTIVSEADNNVISINHGSSAPEISVSASTDNGATWVTYSSGDIATLNNGDKVLLKGVNYSWGNYNISGHYNTISGLNNFHVEGNVMSLLYGDSFIGQTSLANRDYVFKGLFRNSTHLTSAENLVLPATYVERNSYYLMFYGCTSLTTAPTILPATTNLGAGCYSNMFQNCTSLTTAPTLSATIIPESGCTYMFRGCASLATAPELPATTLATSCYYGMFQGCTSLTTAPELPVTTLANSCYSFMFSGCTSLTTAPELSSTTLALNCYNMMFAGCTSLVTAPALPATTLLQSCYMNMFNGCTSLNYIKCLATDRSASDCTYYWVNGVSPTGTFVKNPNMTSWPTTGKSGIPSGWTVQDASA